MNEDLTYLLKIGFISAILTSVVFIIWASLSSTITNYMLGLILVPAIILSTLAARQMDADKNLLKIWSIGALFTFLTMIVSFGFVILTRNIEILDMTYIVIFIIGAFLMPFILIKILKVGKS